MTTAKSNPTYYLSAPQIFLAGLVLAKPPI